MKVSLFIGDSVTSFDALLRSLLRGGCILGAVRGLLGAALTALTIGTTIGAVAAQRGAPPVPAPMPAVLRDYRPVTAERLKNPEDENWLMIRRTYDGWGFSPLTQITPASAISAPRRSLRLIS
jgi:hypothetical protein